MHIITEVQENIMRSLGIFKFLTPSMIKTLGISKDTSYINKQLKNLRDDRRKPLTGVRRFGADPEYGKLEYVHYLTKHGKKVLAEELGIKEENIKAPIGTSTMFKRDYLHRIPTINILIVMYQWATSVDLEVKFIDTYFDKLGNNRIDKNSRAKTRIDLPGGKYFTPD